MREGLPAEIVEYIISFTCDRRGYNILHYNRRKRINLPRMERIMMEIKYFNERSYSISWLRPSPFQRRRTNEFKKSLKDGCPSIVYHTGCFYKPSNEKYSTDAHDYGKHRGRGEWRSFGNINR